MQPLAYIMVPMYRISKLILISVLIACQLNAGNFGQMNFAYWQTPVSGVVASGGTATSGNSYNQWSFTTTGSSTFTVTTGGTVYYAIVAGGGGGGYGGSGGGGAGGVVLGQTTLTAGTYTIVVGTGGTTGSQGVNGTNGGNSSAFGFTAVGGGGAGSENAGTATNGSNGGSGGGGGSWGGTGPYVGGLGVAGQGWSGGASLVASPYGAGGGGGAGGIGGTAVGSQSGNGGTGISVYLPVSNSTVYYGGGGGAGATVQGSAAGSGGTGGGGTGGASNGAGSAGSANTGGGGGGGGNSPQSNGGSGGSGIVVIWSPIATPAKTAYVQYLAVAGGGGGGGSNIGGSFGSGGGGGAGGVLQGFAQISAGTAYTITVGSGGTAGGVSSYTGSNGGNSVFGSFATAIGGGGGNGKPSQGISGGSGGGSGKDSSTSTGGAGTIGQGYNGGGAPGNSYYQGGAGGGYGMAGPNSINVPNGSAPSPSGGDGYTTYISNPATYSWSNVFNGTNYLSIAQTTATDLGSGNFTIEMWVYFNASTTSSFNVAGKWNSGTQWILQFRAAGTDSLTNPHWRFYTNNGSGPSTDFQESSTTAVTVGNWYHLALVRNGNNFNFYRNGSQIGSTYTNSGSITSTSDTTTIASAQNNSYGSVSGYISNFRMVVGTAVYTSAFTPPTTPLTAITNTTLLTCQAGSFSDASTNNLTITPTSSPYIASQNPFGASYAGGGGGGSDDSGAGSYGGMGGGGAGSYSGLITGGSGATNTGSGGGGGREIGSGGTGLGGAGGSGIVILAYPSTFPAASSVTNGTLTTVGGYKVYTFLTSGSITF